MSGSRKLTTTDDSLGFVSTYPPTQCGLATFTQSLVHAIAVQRGENVRPGDSSGTLQVVRIANKRSVHPREVAGYLNPEDLNSVQEAAAKLNESGVAIIQHEFGIFGPRDGESVVTLLQHLSVPAIVTLHTVPGAPTPTQRKILETIVEMADVTVVMSCSARVMLKRNYAIDSQKLAVIPHGAHGYRGIPGLDLDRPIVLTWGLVGPGKGIEWAIRALPLLRDLNPLPIYRVSGATHPNVLRHQGERYRDSLRALAAELDVEDMLELRGDYVDHAELESMVSAAELVLLPYDSREQVTSGVLIDAIAAGKPVVATRFLHACEMLENGGGALVAHKDPQAIATALRQLLTSPRLRMDARLHARSVAPDLAWSSVARTYESLAARLVAANATANVA